MSPLRVAHRPAADQELAAPACRCAGGRSSPGSSNSSPRSTPYRRHLVGLERRDAVAIEDIGPRPQVAEVTAGTVQQDPLTRPDWTARTSLSLSMTSTASAMLRKVLCSTLTDRRSSSWALTRCSVRSATAASRACFAAPASRAARSAARPLCAGSRASALRPAAGSPARRSRRCRAARCRYGGKSPHGRSVSAALLFLGGQPVEIEGDHGHRSGAAFAPCHAELLQGQPRHLRRAGRIDWAAISRRRLTSVAVVLSRATSSRLARTRNVGDRREMAISLSLCRLKLVGKGAGRDRSRSRARRSRRWLTSRRASEIFFRTSTV